MKVLVLGANGMLGSETLRVFAQKSGEFQVVGTVRSADARRALPDRLLDRVIVGVDGGSSDSIIGAIAQVRPDVVVNCIGVIKQVAAAKDAVASLTLNALLPHRLARICEASGSRLIHISTDCVFSGRRGAYLEADTADAEDLYGRSKYLGEVDYPNAVTLRTSIIGHELGSKAALLEWFLAQEGSCLGYQRAVFSGLPTVVLARLIRDVVSSRNDMRGVFHVASAPISKYDLLRLVACTYKKDIDIIPESSVVIDRSLNGDRFRLATDWTPADWPTLVCEMYEAHRLQS